jgi:FkbM family methyltransferase
MNTPFSRALRMLTKAWQRPTMRSFALNELDIKLSKLISLNGGIFVEAGANDGVAQSNTLYFEKYYGWRGLLIEPIPQLVNKCRANRPACIVENCALVPLGWPAEEIEMQYCNLMSLVRGAKGSEEEDNAHIRAGAKVQPGVTSFRVTVPARPLSDVLDQHKICNVDLLSLDVEGYELQALQGLDLARHRPRYIVVETSDVGKIDAHLLPFYRRIDKLSYHDYVYCREHT